MMSHMGTINNYIHVQYITAECDIIITRTIQHN
jgi:hypothetical protein